MSYSSLSKELHGWAFNNSLAFISILKNILNRVPRRQRRSHLRDLPRREQRGRLDLGQATRSRVFRPPSADHQVLQAVREERESKEGKIRQHGELHRDHSQCDQMFKQKSGPIFSEVAQNSSHSSFSLKRAFSKLPNKSLNIWANFVSIFVAKTYKISSNLVTLIIVTPPKKTEWTTAMKKVLNSCHCCPKF